MPAATVDYYFATVSPWAYLGHARFVAMTQAAGATVRVKPVDYGEIFPVSGGLPLAKRAPQRQAYRLVELKRFSSFLGVPLHPQPAHFPVNGNPAAYRASGGTTSPSARMELRAGAPVVGCATSRRSILGRLASRTSGGRSPKRTSLPSAASRHRCTTFCSSRTFPGQL